MIFNSSFQLLQSHCPQGCCTLCHSIRGFWWSVLAWTSIWEVRGWLQHVLPTSVPPKFSPGVPPLSETALSHSSLDCLAHFFCFSQANIMQWSISVGFFRLQNLWLFILGQIPSSTRGRVTATWPALWPAAPNLLRSDSCWLIPHPNKLLTALEFLEQLTAQSMFTLPC